MLIYLEIKNIGQPAVIGTFIRYSLKWCDCLWLFQYLYIIIYIIILYIIILFIYIFIVLFIYILTLVYYFAFRLSSLVFFCSVKLFLIISKLKLYFSYKSYKCKFHIKRWNELEQSTKSNKSLTVLQLKEMLEKKYSIFVSGYNALGFSVI